jgi:hypothetical protein
MKTRGQTKWRGQMTAQAVGNRNSFLSGCKNMSRRASIKTLSFLLVISALVFAPTSRAQTGTEESPGINSGNYNVHESIDVGYRQDWITGNPETYDTFVDLNSGIRLLDYTLNMRSLNQQGSLFDTLNFSNFGYGGDPNDVSRLRIAKNKWYDFSLVFRRDKDFWDYNLLGNPLNPVPLTTASPLSSNPAAFPSIPVNVSPAALFLVQRMQDYNLTLLPQSHVRFRLGYYRDVNEGPSYSSFAGTTNFLLAQNFQMTTNAYHLGVDFRFLSKTTISYDQSLEYNKQDTTDTLANTPFLVQSPTFPGTVPVNLGTNWFYEPLTGGTPCGATLPLAPFPNATPTSLGYANPLCKQAVSYLRTAPGRDFLPTERLSFQSTYIKRLEMSGAASYNSSNNNIPNLNDAINEWTNASATSGQLREAIVGGTAHARQVAVRANWSGIISLTDKIRIVDSLNFDNWRTAGNFNQVDTNLFAAIPQVAGPTGILLPISQFSPLVSGGATFSSICPAPYTAITCPQHGTASAPDTYQALNTTFLGQRRLSNTIQLEDDITKWISGRIGYEYERRDISETPWESLYPSNGTVTNRGATYFPGGTGATAANDYLAARGVCAFPTGSTTLPAGCTLNPDGSVTYTPTTIGSTDSSLYCAQGTQTAPSVSIYTIFQGRCDTTINEQVGLAGFTLRPMDTLHIYSDFEFGYNDFSYTRTSPRQIQSYKIHANYKPRTWMTVDGAVDIHENRDNVSEVYNLEHGRTYSFSTVLARSSNLQFTIGYNYTDIYLQTYICFRDNFGGLTTTTYPGFSPTSGYLFYTPANSACPFTTANATGSGTNSNVNLGTNAFYSSHQHYAYSDIMWKPVNRVTASLGYNATFVGGSTVALNPLTPAGTLAFNYQKPFVAIQFDICKGLSYKTTWNYYAYNSRAPINPSVIIPNGSGPFAGQTYALQPVTAPDFNGSTLLFALRYAF